MEKFKTKHYSPFSLDIKFKDALNVKKLVTYPDGTPVDILEAMETGQISRIYGDIETLINVVFVLCLDEIKERFNLTDYDRDNEATYQLFPEQKEEPPLTKASRWFGEQFDGDAINECMEAFRREIINFTPNGNRKIALSTILEKEEEAARMEAEYQIKITEKMFQQTKEQMETNWQRIESRELQKLKETLDGLSG